MKTKSRLSIEGGAKRSRAGRMSVFAVLFGSVMLVCATRPQAHPLDGGSVQTLVNFDASKLEAPENLVIDRDGNIFMTLVLTGEVRKIGPDGTQTTYALLPIGPPLSVCGPFFNGVTGIALDNQGVLYVAAAACDPANRGVWRILLDGTEQLVANLPLEGLPNGIVLYKGFVYVADSALPRIWRVPAAGGSSAGSVVGPPLLSPPPV